MTTGRIAAARERFNGIRQLAPVCIRNTCFLMPTRVQIQNGMSIGSAVLAQLTAVSRYTSQWAVPFPLKIAPSHGGSEPHPLRGSFGQPESSTQTAPRSVQPFLQGSLL